MHSSLCLDCTIEREGLEVAQAGLELPCLVAIASLVMGDCVKL